MGTLIGHYRHHTVHDPFFHGLTDLTAHVNFTDIAQAGTDAGLDLIGYATQAHFLLNLGITDIMTHHPDPASADYIRDAAAIHKLTGQHEMGELFKVIKAAAISASTGRASVTATFATNCNKKGRLKRFQTAFLFK